ncbi:MAG: AraC family transcriptional regulator N-terminal domain-containing protein [Phycisphaerae bacterium]|nr:AraC family transcriptional regulator [Tepidisphaeraceae bacterium]
MTTHSPDERQARRMDADRAELAERIARAVPRDGLADPQPGLNLARFARPTELHHGFLEPCFCVIAQGAKTLTLGDDVFRYDPARYMIATVGVPMTAQVVEASPDRPYLSLRLDLDPALVGSVMVESDLAEPRGTDGGGGVRAIAVSALDAELLDATVRIVRLIERPEQYRALAPLVVREIVYRLLTGAQGGRMRHLATGGGHARRMVRAVAVLRKDFDKPLRIEAVAKQLGMSTSGFHAHFKAVTAMSPLQFQKRLRLQEARRLMLGEHLDAAEAGYRVGYEDPAYFSRDYKRHFGEPPGRDVERLRDLATA